MKKIILVLTIFFSIVNFGEEYSVVLDSKIKWAKNETNENNAVLINEVKKQIEDIKEYSEEIINSAIEDFELKIELEKQIRDVFKVKKDKEAKEFLEKYYNLVSETIASIIENMEIEIEKIKYISDTEAEVIYTIETVDFFKSLEEKLLKLDEFEISKMTIEEKEKLLEEEIEVAKKSKLKSKEVLINKFIKKNGVWMMVD